MPSGAEAAFRGYRRQALYALYRILGDVPRGNITYLPEGGEDLACACDGVVTEICQVKSWDQPLALSSFRPQHADSFFNRAAVNLDRNPALRVRIVTFGPVGPELQNACTADGPDRQEVVRKLAGYEYLTQQQAMAILQRLELDSVNEDELLDDVRARLRSTLTVVDYEAALDFLFYYIYKCSEFGWSVSGDTLREIVHKIGKFVAYRAAHHQEWYTTIYPIEDSAAVGDQKRLPDEFYQGVSARYEHILANVDVPRPGKLLQVEALFRESNVVIVHGASGQGKSTLAYRYLHDMFPNLWRYEVRSIEGRAHSQRIAAALSEQAEGLRLPMCIYVDVSPQDEAWPALVRQMAVHAHVHVLVTVRQEDFARANLAAHEFSFRTLSLELDQVEAKEIYRQLTERQDETRFLSFDDAWAYFGNQGPLLEFVHIVTQGESLKTRLRIQVTRLREDVRQRKIMPEELHLLRLVSIASGYGASLRLRMSVQKLALLDAFRTLELFEKEYLLRVSANGGTLEGLHPIRSVVLADLLTDPLVDLWADAAKECISLVEESGLTVFLLHSFSRHPESVPTLTRALNEFTPSTWRGLVGCLRALLWLGVKEYVDANAALIEEVYQSYGSGWSVILDLDLVGAGASVSPADRLADFESIIGPEGVHTWTELAERQTDKSITLYHAKSWLTTRADLVLLAPATEEDWAGLAETSFWALRWNVPHDRWASALHEVDLLAGTRLLPLTLASDVVAGVFSWSHPQFAECREMVHKRFRNELAIISLSSDGRAVSAAFIAENESEPTADVSGNSYHDQALLRVYLMRRIWPEHGSFQCKGYMIGQAMLPHDPTEKNIPSERLPLAWLTDINAAFNGLVTLRFRPNNWLDYVEDTLALRRALTHFARHLVAAAESHFRSKTTIQQPNLPLGDNLGSIKKQMLLFPSLPKVAVDEWGMTAEGQSDQYGNRSHQGHEIRRFIPALRRFRDWLSYKSELLSGASNYVDQFGHAFVVQTHFGRPRSQAHLAQLKKTTKQMGLERYPFLSAHNLGRVANQLPEFQQEFRTQFSRLCDLSELATLEADEEKSLGELSRLWAFLYAAPHRCWSNPLKAIDQELATVRRKLEEGIAKRFNREFNDVGNARSVEKRIEWDGRPALCIAIDSEEPSTTWLAPRALWEVMRGVFRSTIDSALRPFFMSTFANVVILTLVRGKALSKQGCVIPSVFLDSDQILGDWAFVAKDLSQMRWEGLGIPMWALPDMSPQARVLRPYATLMARFLLLGELVPLVENLDELGNSLLQARMQRELALITADFEAIFSSIAEIVKEGRTLEGEVESDDSPNAHLEEAVGAAILLHDHITAGHSSNGEFQVSLTIEDTPQWAARFQEGWITAVYLWSAWTSHLISRH